MEWFLVIVYWTIIFEFWKHRNSQLIPKSKDRPIPKTIFYILYALETFRQIAEETTKEEVEALSDEQIRQQWAFYDIQVQGETMDEQIEHYMATTTDYFPMLKRPEFQKAIYKKLAIFSANVKLWHDSSEYEQL